MAADPAVSQGIDPTVFVALITSIAAVLVAWITSRKKNTITVAAQTAKDVSERECADHSAKIRELEKQVTDLKGREDECQTLLALIMERLVEAEKKLNHGFGENKGFGIPE